MTRLLLVPNPNILLWLEAVQPAEELVAAVMRGDWTPPSPYTHLVGKLIAYWQDGLVIATAAPLQVNADHYRPRLSRRSREILKGLLDGLTTRQMALRLGLHPRTIYHHVAALKRQLSVQTRAELAGKAHELLN